MSNSAKRRDFGVRGVCGILARGDALEARRLSECQRAGLTSVEVRADLLVANGGTLVTVLERIRQLSDSGLPSLITLRHAEQGGEFRGSESERIKFYREALRAGAAAVDAEWGTETATTLLQEKSPLVASAHAFDRMLSAVELDAMTAAMTAARPAAIKIVPLAERLTDSVRMLEWASRAPAGGPLRIGFAMGPRGAASRILALAWGSPLTYANLDGAAVAPGQIPALELLEVYRADQLSANTRVYGVVGDKALGSFSPYLHNPAFARRQINAVYIPIQVEAFAEVTAVGDAMGLDGVSVTIPFKKDAFDFATTTDDRSEQAGATNTLLFRRDPGTNTCGAVRAFNTDYDGVLTPLKVHIPKLKNVPVAVIGNGGAARGAVLALKEAGASPTIYYRNAERGQPVAAQLSVPGQHLDTLPGDNPHVIINATPLGMAADDPSPVPRECLETKRSGKLSKVAFEMVYEPAETGFVKTARAAGADIILGREMLVAQGVTQFAHFTGLTPEAEELEAGYQRGLELRGQH